LLLRLLFLGIVGFDKLSPEESPSGCWKFSSMEAILQEIVSVGERCGHPIVAPSAHGIDIAFTFDAGKFGGTVLAACLLHTKDGHGARDVRNCNPIGLGEVLDTGSSLSANFLEFEKLLLGSGPFSDVVGFPLLN